MSSGYEQFHRVNPVPRGIAEFVARSLTDGLKPLEALSRFELAVVVAREARIENFANRGRKAVEATPFGSVSVRKGVVIDFGEPDPAWRMVHALATCLQWLQESGVDLGQYKGSSSHEDAKALSGDEFISHLFDQLDAFDFAASKALKEAGNEGSEPAPPKIEVDLPF
tara:strand:+ start:3637 stop:4140 length:504 start_codon:yes stop_codon:yes gene_type:complete